MPFGFGKPEQAPTEQSIQRRQQIAQALQGINQGGGNGFSGVGGGILAALTGALSGYQQQKALKDQQTLDTNKKAQIAKALASLSAGGNPAAAQAASSLPLAQQQELIGSIAAAQLAPAKKPEAFTLAPGARRFDATGKEIASVPGSESGTPVAIVGDDGKPVYASRKDAIGKAPYAKAGQTPAEIAAFEYFQKLSPEQQARYLEVKRNSQPYALVDVAGGKQKLNKITGALEGVTSAEQEAQAAAAAAGAVTGAKGIAEAQAGQQTKAPAAASLEYTLGQMEPLLQQTMQGGPMGIAGKAGRLFDYGDAARFDNVKQQISTELRTIYRIPGEGSLSDQEQAQYGLQLPDRNNPPEVNQQIIDDLRARTKLRLATPISPSATPQSGERPPLSSFRK